MNRTCMCILLFMLLSQLCLSQTIETNKVEKAYCGSNYNTSNPYVSTQEKKITNKSLSRVDYYTGLLHATIPLGEYHDNDFDIPVSITYTSQGFQPASPEGPVGHNWSLNVGGIITRIINGVPDDNDMFYGDVDKLNPHDALGVEYLVFQKGGYLAACKQGQLNANRVAIMTGLSNARDNFTDSKYEKEPDIFTFSFGEHHGQFIIDANSRGNAGLLISGDQQYKIDVSKMALFNYFKTYDHSLLLPPIPMSTITITSPDGYKYEFGGTMNYCDSVVVYSTNYPNILTESICYIGAWRLKEITAPNNRKCRFVYNDIFEKNSSYEKIMKQYHYDYEVIMNNQGAVQIKDNYYNPYNRPGNYRTSIDVASYTLDTIYVDNRPVMAFKYSEQNKLQSIEYLQNNTTNNFTINRANASSSCYFLEKVSDSEFSVYSFEYNLPEEFPRSGSYVTDHWGFWNNRDAKGDYSKYLQDLNTYKMAEPNTADVTLLSKITYPTGGCDEFDYQPNSYSISYKLSDMSLDVYKTKSGNHNVCGGARVSLIRTFDGTTYRTRRIQYENKQGISSGAIGVMPKYAFIETYKKPLPAQPAAGISAKTRIVCDSSIVSQGVNLDNILGEYHIGYSDVYEILEDGSQINYKFTSWSDKPDLSGKKYTLDDQDILRLRPEYIDIIAARSDSMKLEVAWKFGLYRLCHNSLERGLLERKSLYYANGNPAEEITYIYKRPYKAPIESSVTNRYGNCEYEIRIGRPLLAKDVHVVYPNSQNPAALTYETQYDYNKNNQLITKTLKCATGESVSTQYDYVSNYSSAELPSALQKLQELNRIDQPIGVYNIVNNELVDAVRYDYVIEQGIPLLKREYRFDAPNTSNYKGLISPSINTSTYKNTKTINRYNTYHQPVEFVEYQTGTPTVLIWGYDGQYIISEIQNASLVSVNSAIGIETQDRWLKSAPTESDFALLNSLRAKLPSAHISTYEYRQGVGITQQTDPSGRTIYYEYDDANRLCRIIDDQHNTIKEYEYHYAKSQK